MVINGAVVAAGMVVVCITVVVGLVDGPIVVMNTSPAKFLLCKRLFYLGNYSNIILISSVFKTSTTILITICLIVLTLAELRSQSDVVGSISIPFKQAVSPLCCI